MRASVVNLNSRESSRQGPVIGCRVSEHGGHGFLDDSLVEGALLLAPVPETADSHSPTPPVVSGSLPPLSQSCLSHSRGKLPFAQLTPSSAAVGTHVG